MTFAEYVNKKHPNAALTPWQLKMIHDISSGQATIFAFGRSMGKATIVKLWREYLNEQQKSQNETQ
jgi:hypothetical protein